MLPPFDCISLSDKCVYFCSRIESRQSHNHCTGINDICSKGQIDA